MSAPELELNNEQQEKKSQQPGWFAVSMILHFVAALALIFLTPIREIFLEEFAKATAPSETTMSTQELIEVDRKLDEITENHLERNVQAMQNLLEQMQQVNDDEIKEFLPFEKVQIEESPEIIQDHLQKAVQAMLQAQTALDEDSLDTAITQETLANSFQQTVLQRLNLLQASEELRTAQEQALKTETAAAEHTTQAKKATEELNHTEYRLRYPTSQIPGLEERIKKYEESVPAAELKLKQAQETLQEVETSLKQAQESENQKEIEKQQKRLKYATSALERSQKSLNARQNEKAKLTERLNEHKKIVAELQQVRVEQDKTRQQALNSAKKLQAQALEQQNKLLESIEEEAVARMEALKQKLSPEQTVHSELTQKVETAQTEQLSALELYELAKQLEQQLAEKYRHGRAMRLAIIENVPFADALEAVDLVAPIRPELNAPAMSQEARNQAQLDQKKEVIRAALAESNSMVSLGHSLLTQALATRNESGQGSGGPVSLAHIQARSARMQNLERLANQEQSGRAVDLTAQMQGADSEKNKSTAPGEPPPEVDDSIRPVSGRKISDAGQAAAWMAVSQWYVLGPFDNAGRANINRVFPPESLVDLNAVYTGKSSRPIQWTFTQSDHELGRVSPTNEEPYGIWYAFTELDFDRPRDLWIMMGSDDKGQIWINDELVWVSTSNHKNWSTNEALRRVHFQKGRNKILYRIENGQHGMGFSLWVHLAQSSNQ